MMDLLIGHIILFAIIVLVILGTKNLKILVRISVGP